MLYKALLKIKTGKGFDDAMREKIDLFFALGRLTAEEYRKLLDLPEEDADSGTDNTDADDNADADDANAETVKESAD